MVQVVRDMVELPFGLRLAEVLAGVRAASQAILDVYDKQSSGFYIQTKSDDSPVTAADLASDALLRAALAEILPFEADAIVSEEHVPSHVRVGQLLVTGKPVVFVDPLDGTKEFIKRSGQFVINVGIVSQAKAVFGLIHAPVTGETIIGWKSGDGQYGTVLTLNGRSRGLGALESEPVSVRRLNLFHTQEQSGKGEMGGESGRGVSRKESGRVLKLLLSGSAPPDHLGFVSLKDILQQAGIDVRVIHMGSALKFCRICDGSADIYLRRSPTYYWDTVAGQALVEASGGCMASLFVSQKETTRGVRFEAFEYHDPGFMNPGFAVFGATVSASERQRILQALSEHQPAPE